MPVGTASSIYCNKTVNVRCASNLGKDAQVVRQELVWPSARVHDTVPKQHDSTAREHEHPPSVLVLSLSLDHVRTRPLVVVVRVRHT